MKKVELSIKTQLPDEEDFDKVASGTQILSGMEGILYGSDRDLVIALSIAMTTNPNLERIILRTAETYPTMKPEIISRNMTEIIHKGSAKERVDPLGALGDYINTKKSANKK